MTATTSTNFPGLTLFSRGKVRDIYSTSNPDQLLFVATDRISASDVVLRNGVPDKGKLLTTISAFWFEVLARIIPNHLITTSISSMPPEVQQYAPQLSGRAMLVRKAEVVPLEAIVRAYLTGSAWAEYQEHQTVHGIPMPAGLVESQRLPDPIFTPSTKAIRGQHDENIPPEQAMMLVGPEIYAQISAAALQLYTEAAHYAESCGLIIADTKFEFGLITTATGERSLILVDEALTPDSSRYWPLSGYVPGRPQPSFDKQFLRDWLVQVGFKKGLEGGKDSKDEGWIIEEQVVEETRKKYVQVVELLTENAGLNKAT